MFKEGTFRPEETVLLDILSSALSNASPLSNREKYFPILDWNRFYQVLFEQRLFLVAFPMIREHIPPCSLGKWQATYYVVRAKIKNDIFEGAKLSRIFDELGVHAGIMKGFALSLLIYGNPFTRHYDDVDIYCNQSTLVYIGQTLRDKGYLFDVLDKLGARIPIDINQYYLNIDEIVFSTPGKRVCKFELKKGDGVLPASIVERANEAKTLICVDGHMLQTSDQTTSLYYLFMNAYKNHFIDWGLLHQCPLRDLYDIAAWLSAHPQWDYTALKELAARQNACAMISQIVSLACAVFDVRANSVFRFFPFVESDYDRTLFEILNPVDRAKNYYAHIMDDSLASQQYDLTEGQDERILAVSIRIPVKNALPRVAARRVSGDRIAIHAAGFLPDILQCVDLFLWDRATLSGEPQRKRIHMELQQGSVFLLHSEIEGAIASFDATGFLEICFPLQESILFESSDRTSVLFELYIYWPQLPDPFDAWANVGRDYRPNEFVLSRGIARRP